MTKDNITTVFVYTSNTRITDPCDERKVFSWLIEESWDAKGNLMQLRYKQEDGINVPHSCYENQRRLENRFSNRYLKMALYGNTEQLSVTNAQLRIPNDYVGDFYFKLLFDYGNENNNGWDSRSDAFSNYKSGFEIRTYRLCHRILMCHRFSMSDIVVKSTEFTYSDENSSFTLLKSVTQKGYDDQDEKSLPPLTFNYTEGKISDIFKNESEEYLKYLPTGINDQNFQWADLYSEGVSGILTMNNNAWYFIPNMGDKNFTESNTVSAPVFGNINCEIPKPSAANNIHTTFRINDVDSDGLPELVI